MQRLSDAEKAVIAERAAAGVPSRRIAREMGRPHRTVHGYVERLRKRPPRVRVRSCRQLSAGRAGRDLPRVGRGCFAAVDRSRPGPLRRRRSAVRWAATVAPRRYRAARAEERAWKAGRRPKTAKLAVNAELRAAVQDRLELRWSPQQIAGWLRDEFPGRAEMHVSHETIYLSLFVQGRGTLRKELTRVSASRARDPPTARLLQLQRAGQAPRHGPHLRASRRGRGPGGARALGRRPAAGHLDAAASRPWWSASRGS